MTTRYDSTFCERCEDLMLIQTDVESGKSAYKCPTCGSTAPMAAGRVVGLRRNYHGTKLDDDFTDEAKQAMLTDPTLPTMHRQCIDKNCQSQYVVYTRIDRETLRYRYVCSKGDHTWTTQLAGNTIRTG